MRDEVAREFLVEADALIEGLFEDIESLRRSFRDGHARRELIAKIFRRVHTIKGAGSAAELEVVATIAHEFESLLDGVRRGRVSVDDHVVDAFEDGASAISQALTADINGGDSTIQPELVKNLRSVFNSVQTPLIDFAVALKYALPRDINSALSDHDSYRLQEALEEGSKLFLINAEIELASCDVSFRAISEILTKSGDVIVTVPGIEPAPAEKIVFSILYATPLHKMELLTLASTFSLTVIEIDISAPGALDLRPTNSEADGVSVPDRPAITDPSNTSVRVRLTSLDEIISSAHELMRQMKAVMELTSSAASDRDKDKINTRSELVRGSFFELERCIIGLRMVRAEDLLERARRAGRIVARATGKRIEFTVVGGEVLLDKMVEEAVLTSLMHLVRNAVDHGIEHPEIRVEAGKASTGSVRIEALAEGTRIRFRVVDDGCGISPEKVGRAAIKRGIIPEGSDVDMDQSLRLIFHPGFSTSSGSSSISGRGVGLDIVERSVEQAGGKIKVFSEAGTGTTFEILMSMPLALVPSLVVRSLDQRYCIDNGSVEAVTAAMERGSEIVEWQGERLPLFDLSTLLERNDGVRAASNEGQIIILKSMDFYSASTEKQKIGRFAIGVESVEGPYDALVWSLGRHSARWRGVSGATELPDGSIALLLEISALIDQLLSSSN